MESLGQIKSVLERKTKEVKEYISKHKELQGIFITGKAYTECANACKCDIFYIMQIIRYGKIVDFITRVNGKVKHYFF